MIDTLRQLPDTYFFLILILLIFFFLWLGWKMQGYYLKFRFRREKQNIEGDYSKIQQGMKKIWDEERATLNQDKKLLQNEVKILQARVENYRKKLSGIGIFAYITNKQRSDIIYSLLLENEVLEQLCNVQLKRIAQQNINYLKEQFADIEERQKLMSRIFNDLKIKNYVDDILNEEGEHKLLSKKIR